MLSKRDRTYAAALLFVAYIFAHTDRQVINVLLPSIKASFQLSLVQVSLLQGLAFSLFFAIAGIPLGRAVDRHNRRTLLAVGIAVWSLATVFCGLATSFWQLFAARLMVGVGEACLMPASASLLADSYPPESRGRAISFAQVGSPLGSLVAMVGGGWILTGLDTSGLLQRLGWGVESWHAVFMILGGPGLVLAVLIGRIKEPPRVERPAAAKASGSGMIQLIRAYPVGLISFAAFKTFGAMLSYILLAWMPTIFISGYGLSAGEAGSIVGGLLLVSAVSAYLICGVVSDALMKLRPRSGRVLAAGVVLPAAFAALVWLYFTKDVTTTALALSVPLFVSTFTNASAVPALQSIVPNRLRGVVTAILYLCTNVAGLGLAPVIVAYVAERWGGGENALQQAMASVGLGTVVASALVWPIVLWTYRRMPNYEAEEFAEADVAVAAAGGEAALRPSGASA